MSKRIEGEASSQAEIVLSQIQKMALIGVIRNAMVNRENAELRGLAKPLLIEENDALRALMKTLVSDTHLDLDKYGPAESLIMMGFSDCYSDEKLNELMNTKQDSDSSHDLIWAEDVRDAAEYFLGRRLQK